MVVLNQVSIAPRYAAGAAKLSGAKLLQYHVVHNDGQNSETI